MILGALMVLFFIGLIAVTIQMLQPVKVSRPMSLIEESNYDTMMVDDHDNMLVVQIKGGIHGKHHEASQSRLEAIPQHQES